MQQFLDEEIERTEPVHIERQILLTENARYRSKLRKIREKLSKPLSETVLVVTSANEFEKPSNFKNLPDNSQIIRGFSAITGPSAGDILPFASIMAIIFSYKYSINTWTESIVEYVAEISKQLYMRKKEKFQHAPIHIIPKIGIGNQAYHATIEVVGEGATWQLEDVLQRKYLQKYDRGMLTTSTYSCAFFVKNGIYYLYDPTPCNQMGMRDNGKNGKVCFLRFRTLHDMVSRINYNRRGKDEQQFILSRISVRCLLNEPRMKLPEDYDYTTRMPKTPSSKPTIVQEGKRRTVAEIDEAMSKPDVGYKKVGALYRLSGSVELRDRGPSPTIKTCHFISLIAMLMATMHPIKTWDGMMVDSCIEKGMEIYQKATNLSRCERRMIKNICVDGKIININIKRITVINDNEVKTLEQYLKAVLRKLRYVIVSFPENDIVICQNEGFYHLFDAYPPPLNEQTTNEKNKAVSERRQSATGLHESASWTLYRSIDGIINRLKKSISPAHIDKPEFYTFELTSLKKGRIYSGIHCRLSPLFRPDENPNVPYLKRRKLRPVVDEKLYWLNIDNIPWSTLNATNDVGLIRKTPKTMWKDWNIEFPGDLYSLYGTIHPLDRKFSEEHRGQQYLATCAIAIVMAHTCDLSGWTASFLDGIVNCGDLYHQNCLKNIGKRPNHEIRVEDLSTRVDDIVPFSFTVKYQKIIFGFVYNIYSDRFNLCKALSYFFETRDLGILTSPGKNLAFGKLGTSYFMYDCQSFGTPLFVPKQGASYALKCESFNRLLYCMTLTLNIKRHGQQFHLYSVSVINAEAEPTDTTKGKDQKAAKDTRDTKSSKDAKVTKGSKSTKATKTAKPPKSPKGNKKTKDLKDTGNT